MQTTIPCPECDGTGRIDIGGPLAPGIQFKSCPECDGTGEIDTDEATRSLAF